MKKRLLAIAVMGAALVLSTVMIVSLKDNDKPEITNNQPADNEQPASTPQPAVYSDMVMEKANAGVVGEAAIFTEGERAQWRHIIALGHLPLFKGEA